MIIKGIHHIKLTVTDLEKSRKFFDKEDIKHGEIEKLSNDLYVLAFRDPDNIQLELSWKKK